MRVTSRSLVLTFAVLLAAIVAISVVPGRGSASSAAKLSCAKRAQRAVVREEAVPPLVLPKVKINMASLSGKTVWLINLLPIPELTDIANGFATAATRAGLIPKIFNSTGTVTSWNDGMSQAVSQGAAGIVLLGVPWELVGQPLQQAVAAKIPVVQFSDGGPQNVPGPGIYSHVTFNSLVGGHYMADWVLADSKCHAKVGYLNPVPTGPIPDLQTGFTAEMKHLCPTACSITSSDVPIATLSTAVPTATQSLLQQQPGMNYLVPTFDSLVTFAAPSLIQGGSKAKIIAHDGAATNLAAILHNNSPQKADVALAPSAFQGWVIMDSLARGMLGLPASGPYSVAQRLVDKTNVRASDAALFPTFAKYRQQFLALWKMH